MYIVNITTYNCLYKNMLQTFYLHDTKIQVIGLYDSSGIQSLPQVIEFWTSWTLERMRKWFVASDSINRSNIKKTSMGGWAGYFYTHQMTTAQKRGIQAIYSSLIFTINHQYFCKIWVWKHPSARHERLIQLIGIACEMQLLCIVTEAKRAGGGGFLLVTLVSDLERWRSRNELTWITGT